MALMSMERYIDRQDLTIRVQTGLEAITGLYGTLPMVNFLLTLVRLMDGTT